MLDTYPATDILLNTDIIRVKGHVRFHKGDKVMVTTSFYGGQQKGIIVDGPFFDRLLHKTFYVVRITSRQKIYGGYDCGSIVNVSDFCTHSR